MARTTVYHNDLTSDEKWEKVLQHNKDLFEEFKIYLKNTDKSETTILSYDSDLTIFFTWNMEENDNKKFEELRLPDFTRYQGYLLDLDLSGNRIRRLRASLSSMSNWFELTYGEKFLQFRNVVNKVPAPAKEEVREKTILEDNQVEDLLKHLVDEHKYQQACMVAFVASCGKRKSEVLRAKVKYFIEKNIKYGTLYKSTEKIKTKGHGRNGKRLNIWCLVHPFKEYFDLWIKEREELGIDSEWLFVVKRNNEWVQMKTSTIDTWCAKWTEYIGVDIYFHSFRHYWNTAMVKAGLPLKVIQFLQGWASTSMVELYDDTDMEDDLGKFFAGGEIIKQEKKELSDL